MGGGVEWGGRKGEIREGGEKAKRIRGKHDFKQYNFKNWNNYTPVSESESIFLNFNFNNYDNL